MEKLRSAAVTQGIQRSPNRAMLRAVGFGDADFNKPIVGIANGYSTITPCNIGLNDLAKRAEQSAFLAGAMPQMFGTITVSDDATTGTIVVREAVDTCEVGGTASVVGVTEDTVALRRAMTVPHLHPPFSQPPHALPLLM